MTTLKFADCERFDRTNCGDGYGNGGGYGGGYGYGDGDGDGDGHGYGDGNSDGNSDGGSESHLILACTDTTDLRAVLINSVTRAQGP